MSPSPATLAISVIPYALAMGITPGPNNIMLANSGASYGFARSVPLLLGVVVGFSVLTVLVGLGSVGVFAHVPGLFTVMKVASIIYIVYLAWRMLPTKAQGPARSTKRPLTFLQGAAFQWVNPKAWIMALSAASIYTTLAYDLRPQVFTIAAIFFLTGTFSTVVWTIFGEQISRILQTDTRRRAFNFSMAGALLLSIAPIVLEH